MGNSNQPKNIMKEIKPQKIIYAEEEYADKIILNPGELPTKMYTARNSLLTDLMHIKHVKSVYNLFLAILLGLFLHTVAYDYFYEGRTMLGLHLILTGFARFHYLILLWLCMFAVQFLIFVGFKFWAMVRIRLLPNSTKLQVWDKLWITLFLSYIPLFMYYSTLGVVGFKMPPAASMTLTFEITRLLMKSYAFIRSNVPRVLKHKLHLENHTVLCPMFNQFFYFLWVPALIYKDNYPRTKKINWRYVGVCFLEFFGCLVYMSFMFDKFILPSFEEFGKTSFTWQYILTATLANSIVGLVILVTAFYATLHAWMNAFAEMCRFADRLFYKDWWTSYSYESYFRRWNVIVHDWLYAYIYKDFYEIVLPGNKIIPKNLVFLVSALFHDYAMGFCLRFYTPILFILFYGAGLVSTFIKVKDGKVNNILFWFTLGFGMSVNCTIFALEYYSRLNCPTNNITFWYYFNPALFNCNV